jgi:hypothetical protein
MKHILLRPAFLIVLFVSVYSTQAQKVTGFVTAFKSYPLENAKVKSLKTEKSTFTDSSGRFSLETIPGDVILISAEGFFDRKIKTEKSLDLNIDLRYKFDETSFDEAVKNNHISAVALREALKTFHRNGQKDYSKYQNVFELIRAEISNVRVSGTNVYSIKAISFSMSPQVLYVVNDMVVNDISYISPSEITKIVYLEDNEASDYGIRGANGVLKITLRTR